METFQYTITDEIGIHARPAGELAKLAKEFQSKITIKKETKKADDERVQEGMALGSRHGKTRPVGNVGQGGKEGGEGGQDCDGGVVRGGGGYGLLGEDAGAQGLQRRERRALRLRLERGRHPPADAAQPQGVPHLEEGACQLLARIHDDELIGQPGVAPHLGGAVMVGVGAPRDGDAHVAQVGGHLGKASARVLGDGPRRQRFGAGVQVGAHDPRGRDADAEECLDEGGSPGPLVVVAHDPP